MKPKEIARCLHTWEAEGLHHQCVHAEVNGRYHNHLCPCGSQDRPAKKEA